MNVIFRMTQALAATIRQDLARPHSFAAERVGWITTHAMSTGGSLIILAVDYCSVEDADYIDDPWVGAMMDQEAIRKALETALLSSVGLFHVHMHEHSGTPGFSRVDLREQVKFIPDFFTVRPELPHGAVVMSQDRSAGRVWLGDDLILPISEFHLTGPSMLVDRPFGAGSRGFSV